MSDLRVHPRAARLIATLGLAPHPEGGRFREIHRSTAFVRPGDSRGDRPALTVIYFMLAAGEMSRWHRVASDETWHFHEGAALELLVADPAFAGVTTGRLGPLDEDTQPVRVVPAGQWQAARCTGDYALVSCTVAPGFEFADFSMLRDDADAAGLIRRRQPDMAAFL
jgi:predicted cupin superfamily sugar epimerase